ncbi:MAG: TonB-dependent receptor [Steroidobacteraceae bacterium]
MRILKMVRIAVACLMILVLGTTIVTVSAEARSTSYNFDIPPQNLSDALEIVALASHHKLLYASEVVSGKRSPAIKGQFTTEEAVKALLAGTNLSYEVTQDLVLIRPVGRPVGSASTQAAVVGTGGAAVAVAVGEKEATVWEKFRLAEADQGAAATAAAVEQRSEPSSAKETEALDEILVTAQKRVERLQDVPISISVLTGSMLDKSTGQGLFDELNRVPGVIVAPAAEFGAPMLSLRGVVADGPLQSGSTPIAYYLDTVPFGFVRSAFVPDANAFDLQRVEVLRGPQGTLYGANAEDGVVRVITSDADLHNFDFKARALVSGTDGGGVNSGADVAINVPLVDGKLAIRGVVDYQDLSGWIDRPSVENSNNAVLRSYRLKINAQPTDNLSIGLSAWSSRDHYATPSNSLPNYTAPISTAPEPITNNFDAYGAKIAYQFPHFSITSMTSYIDYLQSADEDASPLGGFFQGLLVKLRYSSRVFSQEFLLSSNDTGPWHWTAGAYYRDARDPYYQVVTPLEGFIEDFTDQSRSYAVFGQLSRRFLNDKLEWTLGLRQFHDRVSTVKDDPTPPAYDVTQSFHSTTPRVVLTWFPTTDITGYASFSEGFRSGIPQYYVIGEIAPGLPPAKPDKLYNYEVGTKADLFEHRLSIDMAGYYVVWRDVQQVLGVPYQGGRIAAIVNGQTASGPGIDIAATARPTKGLQIGGTFSWNNLTFDDDVYSFGQVVFSKGSRLNASSKHTASAFSTYQFPLGGGFTGQLSASANYIPAQGNSGLTTSGAPYTAYGDSVVFANANFSVIFPNHWSVKLFGDNITNEYGSLSGPVYGNFNGYAETGLQVTGRPWPRTIGLTVDYQLR